eukprot:TRINITY_DN864_c0_g1_i1.p1 TRINITY_DN864_c0_g1~~TRINITY_DN864_c0_g1_i1.p1  ORF type:complete len:302 (+),score=144.64 TRINITY_DN864_c0_g1_i1:57-962(+)
MRAALAALLCAAAAADDAAAGTCTAEPSAECGEAAPRIEDALPGVEEVPTGFFEEYVPEAGAAAVMPGVMKTGGTFRRDTWLVLVYAPYCEHSQAVEPLWRRVAGLAAEKHNRKFLKVAKYDATQKGAAAVSGRLGIRAFPTILLLLKDGRAREYRAPRVLTELADYVKVQTNGQVDLFPKADPDAAPVPGEVFSLTNHNYEMVRGAAATTFVKVYAPWCGHCRQMAPAWEELAARNKHRRDVVIAQLDATAHHTARDNLVGGGYPTLVVYTKLGEAKVYPSIDRTVDAMQAFLDKHHNLT